MAASGENPRALSAQVSGVLELLQYFGLNQRQLLFNNNPAAAEGAVIVVGPFPSWCVLFAISGTITKTATMTAARLAVGFQRGNPPPMLVISEDCGPFGATETGQATVGLWLPYPVLLPPNSSVCAIPQIIGTDATASVTVVAEIGVLG